MSSNYDRRERTRDALTRMGVGVLSGAVTTLVATCMLLGAEVEIFFKFGLIVVVNTLLSIIWAFVFFCAYLVTIGPSGDYGNMRKMWQKLLGLCKPAPKQSTVVRDIGGMEEASSRSESADHSELGRLDATVASGTESEVIDGAEQSEELSFGNLRD